jgi:hypothetical protein
MNDTPSLLDWLESRWQQPLVQRIVRFGLAAFVLGWGLNTWLMQANTGGLIIVLAGIALGLWGLTVRGGTAPALSIPTDPTSASADPATVAPTTPVRTVSGAGLMEWLAPLRLPAAFLFPIVGQFLFLTRTDDDQFIGGLAFYLFGLALCGLVVWREKLLTAAPQPEVQPQAATGLRWTLVTISGLAAVAAYFLSSNNRFTAPGVLAWGISVLAWMAAAWDGGLPWATWRERLMGWGASLRGGFTLRLSWVSILLLAALAVGAYFRFAELDAIPPEMTSDHVEKLLDVGDVVLDRQPILFFERNTGREPFQFYWTALLAWLFDTGLTHLSLKIGTALLGFLALPFVFLIGRELEDDALGLLAVALVAMSFWHTAISRVGLRFPLYPVFVAPALYFLLRGLRRQSRNDFLIAGLVMGVGLYGYSPFRVMPVIVLILIGGYCLWPAARGWRLTVATNTVLMLLTVALVFVPLLRYANENPEMFWFRTASRISNTEQLIESSEVARQFADEWTARFGGQIPQLALQTQVFFYNTWNALRMFNWLGDSVWVNTLPGKPVLDVISGTLFVLGAGFLLARLIVRRDWTAGLLLLAVPLLLLPSTLSLAFPSENPSVVRASGVIPVIGLIAAYPVWLLIKRVRWVELGPRAVGVTGATVAVILVSVFALNRDMYFNQYPAQYIGGAQNASEIGKVIRDYAETFGSYDTAWVRPFPFWVDTRAVGMYAGQLRRDYAITFEALALTQTDPRAKLFILHPDDTQTVRSDGAPPTLPELQRLYPNGQLSVYRSARPNRDFLIFFVPAKP